MEEIDHSRMMSRRSLVVVAAFALVWLLLAARAVNLQVMENEFLTQQGEARHLRVVKMSAHRGSIQDRNGEPLAVSTPVDAVWVQPQTLLEHAERIPELAQAIDADAEALLRLMTARADREFVYLRRHLPPEEARRIDRLGVPGVNLLREYRRYYPAGEVAAHVLGFTNVDDRGQEGIELAFDEWLRGEPGAKRVVKDRLGRSIEDVESIRPARPGKDLGLSIDLRLQYLAYRQLKGAVQRHQARSGSVVVLDVGTGEVLAMANQPSFNPNDRRQLRGEWFRNRAVTDIFEPGSSFKPFVIAWALESGAYTPDTVVDTGDGELRVGQAVIRDQHALGEVDVGTVLQRSSNVGATRIALSLDSDQLWRNLRDFGFGSVTESGFPGESGGLLNHHSKWREIGQATLAYGYGVSVTPLQLAKAYATIGAGGVERRVSFLRRDTAPAGEPVISPATADELLDMLEAVVSEGGTGARASVRGYRVAGKTGTSWKYQAGGYSKDRYFSVFGGLAPASDPRVAIVVVLDEPKAGAYYGGEVAAPVFAEIAAGAMRLLNVAPDHVEDVEDETPGLLMADGR